MKYIFCIILTFCSICSLGQNKEEMKKISEIDSLILTNLPLWNEEYLCYSVNDKVVVVSKNKCVYYLNLQEGLLKDSIIELNTTDLFKKSNIKKGKQFCNDDYATSCIGSYVYLSLIVNNQKKFQFHLPYILLCSDVKIDYPFDYSSLGILHELHSSFFAVN